MQICPCVCRLTYLLETRAAKAHRGIQKLVPDAGVRPDGARDLLHVRLGRLAQGGDNGGQAGGELLAQVLVQSGKRHGMIKRTNAQIRDHRGMAVLFKTDGDNIKKYFLPNG